MHPPKSSPPAPAEPTKQERKKKLNHCRFFASKSGCRVGDKCPFVHDVTQLPQPTLLKGKGQESLESDQAPATDDTVQDGMVRDRSQVINSVPQSRVVSKPVPKAQVENPREFQLAQVRRRYAPKETMESGQSGKGTTILRIKLVPSDPDFPFEMAALDCTLSVPPEYPQEKPRLSVKNNDIPRGFALNIERGFDGLVEKDSPGTNTLLGLMKELDKNLEIFLSEKKVETVKIMANADMRHLQNLPVRAIAEPEKPVKPVQTPAPAPKPIKPSEPARVYTSTQKAEAKQRRDAETRQLEARLGRLPLFKKSGDGIAFTIPLDPRKKQELPMKLQAVKSTKLFVPLLYPLEPCRIKLDGVYGDEVRAVEDAFEARARKESSLTLMGHVNYLTVNMLVFAQTIPTPEPKPIALPVMEQTVETPEPTAIDTSVEDDDRSHIKHIPRPPEWDIQDSDTENSSDDYSYDTGDEDEDEEEESDSGGVEVGALPEQATSSSSNNERGTSISFPFMELYGIELLELITLNLSVKCERCKATMDITGLKDGKAKTESCKKCASNLLVCFRKELLHTNAVRAGFLDLEGCIVLDMLPSTFEPTCSQCSTPFTTGMVSVRGETTSNICRECHQKFSFKLPEVKFLRITYSSRLPSSAPRRKKEVLGLVAGQELPRRGRCRHYAKSYRWFRFSCCAKVYACDRCHDEVEEHPNEHANRMICGFCSREGNYRPEDCGVCHSVLVGKKGSGFWEGGKGTRDRTRMSRKDKRKYRRIGGKKT